MLGSLLTALQPAMKVRGLQIASSIPTMGRGAPEAGVATLEAAPDGLLAALQRLVGLGSTSTLYVTTQRLTRADQGPSTRQMTVLPLSRVSTLHYGFARPVGLLLAGICFGLAGLVGVAAAGGPGVLPLLLGTALVVAFFFSRTTYSMAFCSTGGLAVTLRVKTTDPTELNRLCELVHELVKLAEQGGGVPAAAARP